LRILVLILFYFFTCVIVFLMIWLIFFPNMPKNFNFSPQACRPWLPVRR
jgi:hypothetical protein